MRNGRSNFVFIRGVVSSTYPLVYKENKTLYPPRQAVGRDTISQTIEAKLLQYYVTCSDSYNGAHGVYVTLIVSFDEQLTRTYMVCVKWILYKYTDEHP